MSINVKLLGGKRSEKTSSYFKYGIIRFFGAYRMFLERNKEQIYRRRFQHDDYVASECVSIPEYKGIEVDCTVSDDEVQSQLDSFVSQNSTEKKIKKGKCKNRG